MSLLLKPLFFLLAIVSFFLCFWSFAFSFLFFCFLICGLVCSEKKQISSLRVPKLKMPRFSLKTNLFFKKNFVFFIPLILLIIYFLYPIPVTIYNGVVKTIDQKRMINICKEECQKNFITRWVDREFCQEGCKNTKYTYNYNGAGIHEMKYSSFMGLFLKNFSIYITFYYHKLVRTLYSQNIIIILLGLILYYGLVFGIKIMKRLEK